MNIVSTTHVWNWCKETNSFTAEASDLGLRPGVVPRTVELVSEITGRVCTYALKGPRTFQGDIIHWDYEFSHGVAGGECSALTIIND